MKKIVFGIALFISGILGILTSMLVSAIMTGSFGIINDSTKIFAYLDWFGIVPYFICFILLAIIGIVICVKEIYFNKE